MKSVEAANRTRSRENGRVFLGCGRERGVLSFCLTGEKSGCVGLGCFEAVVGGGIRRSWGSWWRRVCNQVRWFRRREGWGGGRGDDCLDEGVHFDCLGRFRLGWGDGELGGSTWRSSRGISCWLPGYAGLLCACASDDCLFVLLVCLRSFNLSIHESILLVCLMLLACRSLSTDELQSHVLARHSTGGGRRTLRGGTVQFPRSLACALSHSALSKPKGVLSGRRSWETLNRYLKTLYKLAK